MTNSLAADGAVDDATAIRAFGIGRWSIDRRTGHVWWDERMCEIMGRPAPTNAVEWIKDTVHEEDRPRVRAAFETAEPGPFTVDHVRSLRPDAEEVWLRLAGRRIGRGERVVGAALDVTTEKLLQVRLAEAERLEMLGRFSAGVSHNFNNMLMIISTCLNELRASMVEPEADEPSLQDVEDALDATHRAAQVVAQLAGIARRTTSVDMEVQNIADITTTTCRLARRSFPERISLEQSIHTSALVRCVPGAIDDVLYNLLINARDALVESGNDVAAPRVHVVVADEALMGESWVTLTVSDNGPGMPEELKEIVFEPFVTTKGTKGTGLGLASAASTVQRHDGHIACRSNPAGGTEFMVMLPQVAAPRRSGIALAQTPSREGERMLVVDDEPAILRALARTLRRAGYSVSTANSTEAVRATLAEGDDFDVVLLDRSLGTERGALLLPELRARLPNASVFFFSGEPVPDDERRLVDGVLSKPCTVEDVTRAIGGRAPVS